MQTLAEEFGFDGTKFRNITVANLDCDTSFDKSSDPQDWCLVRARSQSRSAPLYTEGLFKVLKCETHDSLTDDTMVLDVTEVLKRMPQDLKANDVIPSPCGEYVTIIEIYGSENSDGTISLETKSTTQTIPVELVMESVTYDEAVVELLD